MAGLNSKLVVDVDFIQQLKTLPDDIPKLAARAVKLTNEWFRAVTMAELGYALEINEKKAFKTRFRIYNKKGQSRLWVGLRKIGVHRLGKPVQKQGGVQVGEQFFEKAFISPMSGSQLLVFQRTGTMRKQIKMVELDISADAQEILGSYHTELNRKFEEFFTREFRALYLPQ